MIKRTNVVRVPFFRYNPVFIKNEKCKCGSQEFKCVTINKMNIVGFNILEAIKKEKGIEYKDLGCGKVKVFLLNEIPNTADK